MKTSFYQRVSAFTLIELLVVVAIIVILIAILVPALDKAKDAAMKGAEMTNHRTIVQNCLQYALSHRNSLPSYKGHATGIESYSYDLRTRDDHTEPAGLGHLVKSGYLAGNGLGKVLHCPTLDNTAGDLAGHNMDVIRGDPNAPASVGASWWTDPKYAANRVLIGTHYRGPAYTKNKGSFRTTSLGAGNVIVADILDFRVIMKNGKRLAHSDGYSRGFSDGSASFRLDPIAQDKVRIAVAGGIMGTNTTADGIHDNGRPDERAFEELAKEN